MKLYYLYSLAAMLPLAALSTERPHSGGASNGTTGSYNSNVFKEDGIRMIAFLTDDDDAEHPGKGKGKAKGKAKGHSKDKSKDKEKDAEEAESPPASQSQAPTPQATTPTAQPPASQPSPTERAPAAPRTSTVPQPKRSPAEVKAELNRHLSPINSANKTAALSAVSKETGIPVATLQSQQQANPAGAGALLIANEMAKATKKPAGEFLKARQQGRQWDRIAAENKYDLNAVIPKLQRVHAAVAKVS